MKRAIAAVFVAITGALLATGPVAAQQYKGELGIYGGGEWFSSLVKDEALNSNADSPHFKLGWEAGLQGVYWVQPRFGLRADFAYTERPIEAGGEELAGDINIWDLMGDLMFRLKPVSDEWQGTEMLPYLALGAGAKIINPATNNSFTEPDGDTGDGIDFYPNGPGTAPLFLEHKTSFQGRVALGTLIRVKPSFAIRLELGDKIFKPKVYQAQTLSATSFDGSGDNVGKLNHEIYLDVGLQGLFGLVPYTPPVVVAPPPPPAAPAAPTPPPSEREVSVCVIDPTAAGGTRTVTAMYNPTTGDTTVTVNGEKQPLSASVGQVMLASSADWYVAGRPLALTVNRRRTEFVTYGGARVVEADQLVFLGTVDGLPVYAASSDLTGVDWASLLSARPDQDLVALLQANRDARTAFDNLQVVYVPLQPTGCVFQGLQRVEEVRKGRGR